MQRLTFRLLRIGLILALILLASLLRAWLGSAFAGYPFLTFYVPIAFAAYIDGHEGAFVATFFSVIVAWFFFIPPFHSFEIAPSDALALALFIVTGLGIGHIVTRAMTGPALKRTDIFELHWGAAPGPEK